MMITDTAKHGGVQQDDMQSNEATVRRKRAICEPKHDENGRIIVTDEMRELADALAHPKGDPYLNGRDLGFYCEQCG